MAENFLRLMSRTKPQIKEARRTPRRINTEKNLHLGFENDRIFKLQKISKPQRINDKEESLEAARQAIQMANPI